MTKRLAFASFLLCVLAGCGNKGPLVMPDAPAEPAATPAADTPAAAAAPASGTPTARR